MDYNKIYEQLIEKRKINSVTDGYKENHHILPRSMGGDNSKENLVYLTGREHWVAHLLLHKIHRCSQTAHACHMMAMRCEERDIPKIKNSRMYEHIRKEHAKYASKVGKKRIGIKNGNYGKKWISNIELRESKLIKNCEDIPDGWIKGRNKWKTKICKRCGRDYIPMSKSRYCSEKCIKRGCDRNTKKEDNKQKRRSVTNHLEYITSIYNEFKESEYNSIREFHRKSILNMTVQNLCKQFKKHIPDYNKGVKWGKCFNGSESNIR